MIDKIVLGTVQFGLDYGINNASGQMTEQEVFKILDLAKKSDILTLDTAAAYGNAEQRIGNYLSSSIDQNVFRIITKFNLKQGLSAIESLELSLNRLGVNQVDTIMFHSFDDFKNTGASEIDDLLKLKANKFIRLGISLYTNDQINEICDLDLFEVVQIPFNALDNQALRGEFLEKLKRNNIETHTRSVFLQGLFFMHLDKIPQKLTPLRHYLARLNEISKEFQVNQAALVLHYALSKRYIDKVLIGVDSLKQLENNIAMLNLTVSNEALEAVDEIKVQDSFLLNPAVWHQ